MDKKQIVWTSHAKKEFSEIILYYTDIVDATEFALALIDKTEHATQLISEFPQIGLLNSDKTSRSLIFDYYSIIYEFDDSFIYILSFWDERQNPKNRLRLK
jgi:toxin YoeB